MRVADWHRRAAPGRALVWACPVAVTLIVTVVLGAAGGTPGGGQHLVLAVAVATALTTLLLASGRTASPAVPVRTATTGASGHIEASTAYWCAVAAHRRPQRPRAPEQG
ncbi:hypothetical protein BA895_03590 [Humibacillus sp. DSM 29435]|nr:hypothetical protein BA895_03590 [Humibacillus sp. DSM 29435]